METKLINVRGEEMIQIVTCRLAIRPTQKPYLYHTVSQIGGQIGDDKRKQTGIKRRWQLPSLEFFLRNWDSCQCNLNIKRFSNRGKYPIPSWNNNFYFLTFFLEQCKLCWSLVINRHLINDERKIALWYSLFPRKIRKWKMWVCAGRSSIRNVLLMNYRRTVPNTHIERFPIVRSYS